MKIGWGWKIGIMYGGFVALIMFLVISSSRQHIDLVSKNYYDAEIGYQKVIDAGKNQAGLSAAVLLHANGQVVSIEFPEDFKNKQIACNVEFYAPLNSKWDRNFVLNTQTNSISISRDKLKNTRYTVKINFTVDGKDYYQESEINLHA
jgi:hypothetical protein